MPQDKNSNLPFIVFISGASGAGKTTLLKNICAQLSPATTACFHFDSIGVPSVEHLNYINSHIIAR